MAYLGGVGGGHVPWPQAYKAPFLLLALGAQNLLVCYCLAVLSIFYRGFGLSAKMYTHTNSFTNRYMKNLRYEFDGTYLVATLTHCKRKKMEMVRCRLYRLLLINFCFQIMQGCHYAGHCRLAVTSTQLN